MTQAYHATMGRRTAAAGAVACLLTLAGAVFTPVAHAQDPELVARLNAGLVCTEPDAGNQLLRNADGSGVALNELLMALDAISGDATACAPIKDAASALALELSDANPGQDANAAEASAERMKQVLAEADQRAASVRFEVGPPPRNLTRSRTAPQ